MNRWWSCSLRICVSESLRLRLLQAAVGVVQGLPAFAEKCHDKRDVTDHKPYEACLQVSLKASASLLLSHCCCHWCCCWSSIAVQSCAAACVVAVLLYGLHVHRCLRLILRLCSNRAVHRLTTDGYSNSSSSPAASRSSIGLP